MKYFNLFAIVFSSLYVLTQCDLLGSNQSFSLEQRDSILNLGLKNFIDSKENILQNTEDKLNEILVILDTLKPKPLSINEKIALKFPVCGGSSDSCRFDSPHLALILTNLMLIKEGENLIQQKNKWYSLTPHEVQGVLRNFWEVRKQSYKPINHQFKDTPFQSVLNKMTTNFYDLQMLFKAKWLLVLEIKNHQAPVSEYGGGSLEGNWHVFDFEERKYMGSMPLKAQNTPNFRPPTTTTKEVEKIDEKQRYDGKRFTTDRTKVKTQEKTYTTQEQQYYYAQKNLLDNFQQIMRKTLNEHFSDEKGGEIHYF